MTEPTYEYWGKMAQLWDAFRGDTSTWADRAFYLEAIRRFGEPVLDVGCGTGRLLLDFAAQGIDIDGVDNSPEMLALCREKAAAQGLDVTLYQQQMQDLALPRRYQTILVPSSSFQLLTDPADARTAIRRFFDHLLPGGWLVMPFMAIWKEGMPLDSGWELYGELPRTKDGTEDSLEEGATVRRWSRSIFDPDNQWESTQDRYEVIINREVVESELHVQSPATRSYAPQEAIALYREAGFEEIESFSEFTWEPALSNDVNAKVIVVTGRRPHATS